MEITDRTFQESVMRKETLKEFLELFRGSQVLELRIPRVKEYIQEYHDLQNALDKYRESKGWEIFPHHRFEITSMSRLRKIYARHK